MNENKTKEQLINELQTDEEIRLLITLIQAISESEDLNAAIEIALRKICEATGWDYGEAWIPGPDGTVLKTSPVWYSSTRSLEKFRKFSEKFTFMPGTGLPGRIWLSKLPEWIPDVSKSPETVFPHVRIVMEAGLKACLGVPIIAKEHVLAVLSFFMLESREKDELLVDIVSAVAAQLGSVIRRKQAEEELRKAEAKYRSIFENAIEGIYQTALDGCIVSANPAFARMLGYASPHDLITEVTDIRNLYVDPGRRDDLIHLMQAQGFVENFEVQFYCKDGKVVWFLLNTRILRDYTGNVCFEGMATDITDRKQAEKEILKLNRELEQHIIRLGEANKELEAFSYSVSHDLRAPLRAIDGFSNILLKDHAEKLDREGRRVLNIIRINTQKMGELIDSLLTLSRLGRKEMVLSDIDMCELAKAVYEELRATAPSRVLQFNIKTLPAATGDTGMIRQVFVNLLSNAIKFTRPKEIAVIEVSGWSEKNENIYYVRDNGAGFDMQYSDKLFGVFQRLHGEEEFEGTGVGLAIIQRIIQRHGGRVWAVGKVNEGATFYFALPIKEKV